MLAFCALLAAIPAPAVGSPCLTVATAERPAAIFTNAAGRVTVDFGRDAFGWLEFVAPRTGDYFVVLGEKLAADGSVERGFAPNVRTVGAKWRIGTPGVHRVPIAPDMRNSFPAKEGAPIPTRPEFGVVTPFRAVEVFDAPFEVTEDTIRRQVVSVPADRGESAFACDSDALVRVYDFCRHTMFATSFAGLFVDGDRERIPYEADGYVSQLNWLSVSSENAYPRASVEYLMDHPTWPTEFRFCSVFSVWTDWMWSGRTDLIERFFDRLSRDNLHLRLRRPDGLLLTGGERPGGSLTNRLGVADIVDWPKSERDGFDFRDVNAVVNAFHFRALGQMADMAKAIGRENDAVRYAALAEETCRAYRRTFIDPSTGLVTDGEGSTHSSLHANAAALAFGLVPDSGTERVADWLVSRGMACSVYFSQYLLDALYRSGRDEAALRLLTSRTDRSWLGMLDQGATMTMEAWNMDVKPNMDWNHAWGAVPLNVIVRGLLGVTPLEPGFRKISIAPQPGSLQRVTATIPTAAGSLGLSIDGNRLLGTTPAPAIVTWRGKTRAVEPGSFELK